MSHARGRTLSLAGIDLSAHSATELRSLVRQTLEAGIHGLCFSPYVAGQGPGTEISEAQIRERLGLVAPHARWFRTFSCTEGHERIPRVARSLGKRTLVGAWLDDDLEHNELELAGAIAVAREGCADIVAVGNEVLYREELSAGQLIDYIQRVKRALPGIPVGYVDAYYHFEDHPEVTAACDVVLANCYPFWERCPAEHALLYMKEMVRRAQRAAGGKPVIISETGWPDRGTPLGGAVPSELNAIRTFLNTAKWAEEDEVPFFWFSAFDEAWKVDAEGDVGAFWGLWDAEGRPKHG